jgi:hypothetical protein
VRRSIALPIRRVNPDRVKVTIPGIKTLGVPHAIQLEVRKARQLVAISRQRDRASKQVGFPRSSSLRPNPEEITQFYTKHTEGNNGGYFFTSTPASYVRYNRTWTGARTPRFGSLKKAQLPVNPHTVKIVEILDGYSSFQNYTPDTGVYFNEFTQFTTNYAAPPDTSAHIASAQFQALRKLIDNAGLDIEANIAQDFAQIGQTVKLIGNTAKRLTRSLIALKKGNIPGAVKELWGGHLPRYNGKGPSISKSLANNWLELQYGWKPLLQDIIGVMKSLKQLNAQGPDVKRVTGVGSARIDKKIAIMAGDAPTIKVGEHSILVNTRCKYVIYYKIDDRLKSFLAQLGFTNPLNLGWEILPFSFVVDWFIPIGPYLETLSSWDGLSFVSGSVTNYTKEEASSIISSERAPAPGQYAWRAEHGRYSRQVVSVNRAKLLALPSAKIPSVLKNGLASTTHATNALALLRAAFK